MSNVDTNEAAVLFVRLQLLSVLVDMSHSGLVLFLRKNAVPLPTRDTIMKFWWRCYRLRALLPRRLTHRQSLTLARQMVGAHGQMMWQDLDQTLLHFARICLVAASHGPVVNPPPFTGENHDEV
ncbi:MAG: hypothetical protein COU11_04515 [Candidatus Harrisonbacteria bacterium CG10_big_fil_rev_8_21_14_0_10_49_15]|uniref:Uncharacterized protein n=1 Tax=Candidatus Harrisonbacteria bacterium CG10_big_fil_rev_8_21_14_0_10_49_15 TaxID=1974587 RepID=A0A2H0UK10_9BACT|nr:MAG: hypothetical protein COU11_04515 [Candidatus Harrisonbacteria bacterium CG10_big_fil_rev_8_21_14_0_10_49_15]